MTKAEKKELRKQRKKERKEKGLTFRKCYFLEMRIRPCRRSYKQQYPQRCYRANCFHYTIEYDAFRRHLCNAFLNRFSYL